METRERLLQSALTLFAERGTDGASMRELARRAGVNIATAYHHFGSKRGLYLAVLKELGYLEAFEQGPQVAAAALKGASQREVLEVTLVGTLTLLASGAEVLRLVFQEALKGDEDARAVLGVLSERGIPKLEWLLVETGVSDKTEAPQLAGLIYTIVMGVFSDALLTGTLSHQELARRASEIAPLLERRRS